PAVRCDSGEIVLKGEVLQAKHRTANARVAGHSFGYFLQDVEVAACGVLGGKFEALAKFVYDEKERRTPREMVESREDRVDLRRQRFEVLECSRLSSSTGRKRDRARAQRPDDRFGHGLPFSRRYAPEHAAILYR